MIHKIRNIFLILLMCTAGAHTKIVAEEVPVKTLTAKEQKAYQDSLKRDLKEAKVNTNDKANPNFATARQLLAHAFQNPYGKENPDVFLQAANTEYQCFHTERNKPASGKKMDEKVIYASTAAGFRYYQQAYRLYRHPQKGSGVSAPSAKVLVQMRSNAYDLYRSTQGFRATAGYYFRQKNWASAHEYFRLALESMDDEILKDFAAEQPAMNADFARFRADSIRQRLLYSCAVTAVKMEDPVLAIRELEGAKYCGIEPNRIRQQLCKEYLAIKDTLRYEGVLREGVQLMADEPWYAENLLNLYLTQNDHKKALTVINLVIKNTPGNAHNVELKGQLLDEAGDIEGAEEIYKLAIAYDTTLLISYSSLGRIYFNRALEKENAMVEERRFDELYDVVVPLYEEALPYYNKAYENDVERKDESIASAIRTILFKRFQSPKCKNAKQLIRRYNEVSKAYGMSPL